MASGTASSLGLHARPGDRLVIRGHTVGARARDGEILEAGRDGGPPFLVRWTDDGHVSRIYPGSDAFVQQLQVHQRRHETETSPTR